MSVRDSGLPIDPGKSCDATDRITFSDKSFPVITKLIPNKEGGGGGP